MKKAILITSAVLVISAIGYMIWKKSNSGKTESSETGNTKNPGAQSAAEKGKAATKRTVSGPAPIQKTGAERTGDSQIATLSKSGATKVEGPFNETASFCGVTNF